MGITELICRQFLLEDFHGPLLDRSHDKWHRSTKPSTLTSTQLTNRCVKPPTPRSEVGKVRTEMVSEATQPSDKQFPRSVLAPELCAHSNIKNSKSKLKWVVELWWRFSNRVLDNTDIKFWSFTVFSSKKSLSNLWFVSNRSEYSLNKYYLSKVMVSPALLRLYSERKGGKKKQKNQRACQYDRCVLCVVAPAGKDRRCEGLSFFNMPFKVTYFDWGDPPPTHKYTHPAAVVGGSVWAPVVRRHC